MAGRVKVPVGWDVLEGRIKWSSFDETTIGQLAQSTTMQQLSFLGDLQTLAAAGEIAETPVIMNMTAICKDIGGLDFKAQELVEYTSMFDVYHVDLMVGGVQVYVYDAMSNLYIVNGQDQLAQYRANIGG
jgi:P2 family phage contractile tail tube protein